MESIFQIIAEFEQSGRSFVLVTVVEKSGHGPAEAGARMIVNESGRLAGTVGGGALEYAAVKEAKKILDADKNQLIDYFLGESDELIDGVDTGMICGGAAKLFYEINSTGYPCFVFGAGHIGEAVVKLLADLPYRIILADNREDILASVPFVSNKISGSYDEILKKIEISENAFCVLASQSHSLDFKVVKHLLKSKIKPKYIGLVASKVKNEELHKELKAAKISVPEGVLYSPVGLNIGGRTPADIALAIVAEMQKVRHKIDGPIHMKDK